MLRLKSYRSTRLSTGRSHDHFPAPHNGGLPALRSPYTFTTTVMGPIELDIAAASLQSPNPIVIKHAEPNTTTALHRSSSALARSREITNGARTPR